MQGPTLRPRPHIKSALPTKARCAASKVCRSNRQFSVADRGACRQIFGSVDDGIGVNAVVPVELIDAPGLTEMLDAKRFQPMAAHAAEPPKRRGMAIDDGNDAAIARQRREQFIDVADIRHPVALAPQLSCASPAGV